MKATLTFKLSDDVTLSIESDRDPNCARCLRSIARTIKNLKTKDVEYRSMKCIVPDAYRDFDVNCFIEDVKDLRDMYQ